MYKCGYCDFLSFPLDEETSMTQSRYLDALVGEMRLNRRASPVSLYVGGGTPSLLGPEQIEWLGGALRDNFRMEGVLEFTLEANPETVSTPRIEAWGRIGVNRISLGVQSFNGPVLRGNGRPVRPSHIYRAFRLLREGGVDNIGIDLILGLRSSYNGHGEERAAEVFREDLRRAVELKPEHLSVYLLSLSGNSEIGRRVTRGEITPLDDRSMEQLYLYTVDYLGLHGYEQYEISNFARTGYKSLHNTGYWSGDEYLGTGLGAVSTIGDIRTRNHHDLETYINSLARGEDPVGEIEALDDRIRSMERIMLSLRQPRGVSLSELEGASDRLNDYLEILQRRKFAVEEDGRIALTPRGFLRSNAIIADIIGFMEDNKSRHS
jgi:oxygen-independent coproporphyrinogen-3 oxidase